MKLELVLDDKEYNELRWLFAYYKEWYNPEETFYVIYDVREHHVKWLKENQYQVYHD